jgi:hypothetical protein
MNPQFRNTPAKHNSLRRFALAASVALAMLPALGWPVAAQASERDYLEAIRVYRSGRLSEAFGRFVALAHAGDKDAARIALFMHKYGPTLYGGYWDLAPHEVAAWSSLLTHEKGREEPVLSSVLTSTSAAKPVRRARPPEAPSVAHNGVDLRNPAPRDAP